MPASKQIGIIGVGSMGGNIARRLYDSGYNLVLYNKAEDAYAPFRGKDRISIASDMADLCSRLRSEGESAIVWMMVPGGAATNEAIVELSRTLRKGDIAIDGSNSLYTDSIANYNLLGEKGISYLDVGCAGGPNDLLKGVALYVGGDRAAFKKVEAVFKAVCGKGDYGYVGGAGAGQLVKFIHNGIFYAEFPVASEAVAGMVAMGKANPNMRLNAKEAVRLMAKSPPITTGIMEAISEAMKSGIPEDAPQMSVSAMVRSGAQKAGEQGVKLELMNAVLDGYGSMSKETRRIYAAAKKILTGH